MTGYLSLTLIEECVSVSVSAPIGYTVLVKLKLYLMTFFLTLPLTVCKHPYRDHYCTDRHQATYCDQLGTAYFVLGIDPVFGEIMPT